MTKLAYNFQEGEVLLIDKPLNWTSFDVVKKIRSTIKVKKIGHAGTLDPLATGLLILCTGRFTKKIQQFQNLEKEYTGTITLGKTTASYDLETKFEDIKDVGVISPQTLVDATKSFVGKVKQIPPAHSAIKIGGERVYKKARRNEQVTIEAREVNISEFEVSADALPEVNFRVVCSKGTYIRSLAHDYGQKLETGAYLSSLRRTRIGEFDVQNAWNLEEFIAKMKELNANH